MSELSTRRNRIVDCRLNKKMASGLIVLQSKSYNVLYF